MIESLHVIDERELREQLKSGWLQSKIRENHSKYPRVGRFADIVIILCKYRNPAIYRSPAIKKYHNYEMWVTQRKCFKKAVLEVRLVFASTQISTIIRTSNNAICILPKVSEVKQVENIIFWKNKQKYIWNNKGLCNDKI